MSKLASLFGLLFIAGAVAVSAPGVHSLVAQSAVLNTTVRASLPDQEPRWRVSTPAPTPPPVPASVTAQTVSTAPPAAQAPLPPPPPPPPPPPAPVRTTIGTGQWGLINQDRAANGLPPLQWSGCLAAIASQNAARMAAQGFISHANGVTLDLGCHLDSRAGENVGYLSMGINDAEMNTMFMNSAPHRANIVGPYRYVGVAWVVAPNGAAYIAVEFS